MQTEKLIEESWPNMRNELLIQNTKQFKSELLEHLENKKIVIWGTGDEGARFYNEYCDVINIIGLTANYTLDTSLSKFKTGSSTLVKNISEFEQNIRDYYFVISIDYDINYLAVEYQLEQLGLKYGENFVDSLMADAILSRKKIVVTAGDCLLDALTQGLGMFDAIREKYYIHHFYYLGRSKYFNKLYFRMSQICDVYIMNRHMDNPSDFYFEPDMLGKHCRLLYVATPEFKGYWPQTPLKEANINPFHIAPYGRPVDFTMREDVNITKAIKAHQNVDELVKRLLDDKFYTREQVLRNYDVSIKMIQHAEEGCDVSISDFFMSNAKEKWLAKDYSHYQNILILELCRRILVCLGEKTDYDISMSKNVLLPFTEMPIYPSVSKALELKFVSETTKYQIRTYQGNQYSIDPYTNCKAYYSIEEMTFEEYIRRYYQYCVSTKQLMEVW